MIRIESHTLVPLSIPLDPMKGNKSKMLKVPPMTATGPGVLELPELDAVTIARLRWHYDRRPHDGKAENTSETDENGNARFLEIGLLKIIITGGKMASDDTAAAPVTGNASSKIEPPRRAAPAAPKAAKSAAAPKAKDAPKRPRRVA